MRPFFKTPRQRRAMEAFARQNLSSRDVQNIAGVQNAPELIAGLRRLGWIIHCETIDFIARDGRKCYPGLYSFDKKQRGKALELLEVAATTLNDTKPSSSENTQCEL